MTQPSSLTPALPLPAERDRWLRIAPQALAFWQAAAEDTRVSPPFRALCEADGTRLASALKLA